MVPLDSFTSVVNYYLPEPHASLLNGILFGVRLNASQDLRQAMRYSGLLHIVVLSGMNIAILAGVSSSLTASLGKKMSLLLTMLIIIIFVAFVGAQAPIVRAAFMGILTAVAIANGKRNLSLYGLALSGIFIACIWPQWLSTLSFQLSYGATFGIIMLGHVTKPKNQTLTERIKYSIWKELKPSLAAQLLTTPLIAWHFKEISLIAPLSNLLAAPLIAPLMIFGFLTVILGKINIWLGVLPSYICFGLLSCLIYIIDTCARVPFAHIRFF